MVKRVLSIGTLLSAITGLLVVVLVAAFAVSALSAYHREKQSRMLVSVVSGARDIMAPMIAVRSEVTLANLVLEAPQAAVPGTVAELRRLHARTDAALDIALREIAERPFSDAKSRLPLLLRARDQFHALFPRVVAAIQQPRSQRGDILDIWKAATTLLSRQLAIQSAILGEHMPGADPSIDHMM